VNIGCPSIVGTECPVADSPAFVNSSSTYVETSKAKIEYLLEN
jgi:hypothetical protein